MSRRWPRLTRAEYGRAMERAANDVRLLVAAPTSDAPTTDVIDAWRQPEARALWNRLLTERVTTRSSAPGLQFAMGVLLALGALRATPHILHAHDLLLNNAALFALVSELAASCESPARCEPAPISYAQVTRHLRRLSEGLAAEVHLALGDIAVTFQRWNYPVGRNLAVDGSLVPAWAQQRSGKAKGEWNQQREDRLRRRTPEAGFVMYSRNYLPEGLDARAHAEAGHPKRTQLISAAVRGYGLTALVDLATGLTLAFDLRDATTAQEPRVLRDALLPMLFDLAPALEVQAIVGDAKYDDNPTHEHLETHYGIHLVAVRKRHALARPAARFTEADHPSVAAVRTDGIAICRAHSVELEYRELSPGPTKRKQLGLRPGQELDPRAFRSRFECPHGCGKVSVATRECWSHLPYYPRTPHGRHKLFAQRRALLNRRNQIESVFSALQVGYKVSLDGAARTRAFDRSFTEALIALSIVTKALLLLRAERVARGEVIS
jgi:hypothetical protein